MSARFCCALALALVVWLNPVPVAMGGGCCSTKGGKNDVHDPSKKPGKKPGKKPERIPERAEGEKYDQKGEDEIPKVDTFEPEVNQDETPRKEESLAEISTQIELGKDYEQFKQEIWDSKSEAEQNTIGVVADHLLLDNRDDSEEFYRQLQRQEAIIFATLHQPSEKEYSLSLLKFAPRLSTFASEGYKLTHLEDLENCENLEVLKLGKAGLSGKDMLPLVFLSERLRVLYLRKNNLDSLEFLGEYKALRELDVSGNEKLINIMTLETIPTLKTVYAHRCGFENSFDAEKFPEVDFHFEAYAIESAEHSMLSDSEPGS